MRFYKIPHKYDSEALEILRKYIKAKPVSLREIDLHKELIRPIFRSNLIDSELWMKIKKLHT
jgi:hypothetical protein